MPMRRPKIYTTKSRTSPRVCAASDPRLAIEAIMALLIYAVWLGGAACCAKKPLLSLDTYFFSGFRAK